MLQIFTSERERQLERKLEGEICGQRDRWKERESERDKTVTVSLVVLEREIIIYGIVLILLCVHRLDM
jgi:hypothetical protein